MAWIGWICWKKILMQLCGLNFCINYNSLARFEPSIVKQQNRPKCTQTLRNKTKHEFWVQWGGSGAFIATNSDTTSWHEQLHQLHHFSSFCTEFHAVTKWSQMHPNTTKRIKWWVWGPMGWIGCVCCENIWRNFVAQTFALIAAVQPILHWVYCRNKTIPNAPKH